MQAQHTGFLMQENVGAQPDAYRSRRTLAASADGGRVVGHDVSKLFAVKDAGDNATGTGHRHFFSVPPWQGGT
jgi:hypothetical protein